jgi:hypothetical protein
MKLLLGLGLLLIGSQVAELARAQLQAHLPFALGVAVGEVVLVALGFVLEVALGEAALGIVMLFAADFHLMDRAKLGSVKLRLRAWVALHFVLVAFHFLWVAFHFVWVALHFVWVCLGLFWLFLAWAVVVFVLIANGQSCACWSRR